MQRALGVAVEPLLIPPAAEALVEAADGAGAVVVGLSDPWAKDGLGSTRSALTQRAVPPVLLVRRGLRQGGLAPAEGYTRFTWSLAMS